MTKPLKILLLEDDLQDCKEIEKYVNTLEDVTLIGMTGSCSHALEQASHEFPEAIIIDLELHKGSGNGLQFLTGLKHLHLPHHPYLLVTTNNPSHTTHAAVRSLGADFILTKYEADYSAQYVVDFLRMMREVIDARNTNNRHMQGDTASTSTFSQNFSTSPHTVTSEHTLLQTIYEEMNLIGISPKTVGYKYLADAIFIKIKNPDINIYAMLGPRYQKTDTSIERAMQNAINRAWRTSDPTDLLTYYTARIRSDRGVPTIMEFIYYYATKLQTDFDLP